jgi:hypothetical protein
MIIGPGLTYAGRQTYYTVPVLVAPLIRHYNLMNIISLPVAPLVRYSKLMNIIPVPLVKYSNSEWSKKVWLGGATPVPAHPLVLVAHSMGRVLYYNQNTADYNWKKKLLNSLIYIFKVLVGLSNSFLNFFLFFPSYTLQMKSRRESNINVWFPFMYAINETVQPPYFQYRIIMFCLPIPMLIYL